MRIATLASGKRQRTRLYEVWASMRKRCLVPTCPDYPRYGGRGVVICDEWSDFAVFREWAIANGYRKGLTLDREDSDRHYTPYNCRWIPKGDQQANIRRAIRLTHNGVTQSLYQWARVTGFNADQLRSRVYSGWTAEQTLTLPLGTIRPGMLRGRAAAKAKRLAFLGR